MVKNKHLKKFVLQKETLSPLFCQTSKNTLKALDPSRNLQKPSQGTVMSDGLNVQQFNSNPYKCTKKRILTHFRSVMSDQHRRGQFEINELRNIVFKSLFRSQPLGFGAGFAHFGILGFTALAKKGGTRYGSLTSVRNRCVLTGYPQTLKHLRLSRIQIRFQAGRGKIPGCVKV